MSSDKLYDELDGLSLPEPFMEAVRKTDEEIESLRAKNVELEAKVRDLKEELKPDVRTVCAFEAGRQDSEAKAVALAATILKLMDTAKAWLEFCNGLTMKIPTRKEDEGREKMTALNGLIFKSNILDNAEEILREHDAKVVAETKEKAAQTAETWTMGKEIKLEAKSFPEALQMIGLLSRQGIAEAIRALKGE